MRSQTQFKRRSTRNGNEAMAVKSYVSICNCNCKQTHLCNLLKLFVGENICFMITAMSSLKLTKRTESLKTSLNRRMLSMITIANRSTTMACFCVWQTQQPDQQTTSPRELQVWSMHSVRNYEDLITLSTSPTFRCRSEKYGTALSLCATRSRRREEKDFSLCSDRKTLRINETLVWCICCGQRIM